MWVTTQFGIDIENLLAYIFVLSLGILHGSNDLKLIGNFSGEIRYTFRTKLSIYIFVVLFILRRKQSLKSVFFKKSFTI